MTSLRWGILGPGRIATRHARAILGSERAELVAVASRDADRARAFASTYGIPRVHDSYEALIDDPDVDVIAVTVPNHLHTPWTVRALEAGKHVLCEKPLTTSVKDVDAIIEASQRTDRMAVEAFMYVHHPQIIRAVELARRGALGPLVLVSGSFTFFLTDDEDPRAAPEMGGGSIWDVGSYPISFARRVAGEEPDALQAFATFDGRGIDRTFLGQMHFPSGLLARFDCGFAAPDRQRLEIVGADASLILDAPFLTTPDGPPPSLTMWRGDEATPIEVTTLDQYVAQVDDLSTVILDGKTPRLSLESSRGNVATIVELDRLARASAASLAG